MKRTVLVILGSLLAWSQAEEASQPILAEAPLGPNLVGAPAETLAGSNEAWVGISVSKPDEALLAHLLGIPKGVGFTVTAVEASGPAAAAGIAPYDCLWKLDDQLLINEGQFIALLGLRKVGDTVRFTFQRQGKNVEAEVLLMARPEGANGRSEVEQVLRSAMASFPLADKTINVQEQYARHEGPEGVVKVRRGADHFFWMAWDSEGEPLARGRLALPDESGGVKIPENLDPVLKGKLSALIRAYEHAAGRGPKIERAPRVRRVPTPANDLRR